MKPFGQSAVLLVGGPWAAEVGMNEFSLPMRIYISLIFCILSIAVILLHLMPLSSDTTFFNTPDIILVIIVAWALRAPVIMTPYLAATVCLLADFLLQRPPGLWSFCVVLIVIGLRAQAQIMRRALFLSEWALAAAAMIAVPVLYYLIRALTFMPGDSFAQVIFQVALNILIYPVIAILSARFFAKRANSARGLVAGKDV